LLPIDESREETSEGISGEANPLGMLVLVGEEQGIFSTLSKSFLLSTK
jgi:hypothetical protein